MPALFHTLIAVALVLAQPAHQPANAPPPAPAALIIGPAREIAAPGIPGPLVLFGEHAFPIAAGRIDKDLAPVVAGSTLGDGRVVAFGHTGYLDADRLAEPGTAAILTGSLRWIAPVEGRAARVAVLSNPALAAALSTLGFDATTIEPAALANLDGFDALCVGVHALDVERRGAVRGFVHRGGGLLAAGLGWGWLQLNPGKAIREHPGNLLLAEAGICWADGYLSRTTESGFGVGAEAPIPGECHADAALAAIERAAAGGTPASAQAAATLSAAVRVIPLDHTMMTRCRALLHGREASLAPMPESPLNADRGVERSLLALQVELERQAPPDQVAAHASAPGFPGAVPSEAERITRDLSINPSIPGWHSTGLYAAPGEVITITIPAAAAAAGLSARIGCHTDHLWHHNSWRRVPDISRSFPLMHGVTRIASAYGGLVYIEAPSRARAASPIEVSIAGAVAAPRYVLGRTTAEQWSTVERHAPAPWAELETSKIIVSVPSEFVRDLEDPESLMRFWDEISDAHATLATIPLDRPRPERFVADIQISAGYMHSGYPIMTHLDAAEDMTSLDKLRRGSWGLLHELGHNHQDSMWTFDGTGEVTVNLFSLYAIDTVCTPPPGSRGHPAVDTPPSIRAYLERGAKFEHWKRDPFLALQMYIQMEREFGWETFKRVFAEYRELPNAERPKGEDQKRDQWMVRFSRACGRDLGPFFEAWGVPTSEGARSSIKGLPVWMPEGMEAGTGTPR